MRNFLQRDGVDGRIQIACFARCRLQLKSSAEEVHRRGLVLLNTTHPGNNAPRPRRLFQWLEHEGSLRPRERPARERGVAPKLPVSWATMSRARPHNAGSRVATAKALNEFWQLVVTVETAVAVAPLLSFGGAAATPGRSEPCFASSGPPVFDFLRRRSSSRTRFPARTITDRAWLTGSISKSTCTMGASVLLKTV